SRKYVQAGKRSTRSWKACGRTGESAIWNSSSLRFVLVGADLVLGAGDRIVWQAFIVHAIAVRVPVLFIERGVALNRALVNVRILPLLDRHRDHVRLLINVGPPLHTRINVGPPPHTRVPNAAAAFARPGSQTRGARLRSEPSADPAAELPLL